MKNILNLVYAISAIFNNKALDDKDSQITLFFFLLYLLYLIF